jgi:hypothetical protein
METRKPVEPIGPPEAELQQGGGHSAAREDRLKRTVRRHPQRDIPKVESIEPPEAPVHE